MRSQSSKKRSRSTTNNTNNFVAAKNSVRPSEGAAEGGWGGNSASPEPKRSPAALLVQSRTQQKSFLFLLPARIATQSVAGGEEIIRRVQIRKSEENFFVGWRASARGGGAASLVPFKVGSRKVYNYSTNSNSIRHLGGVLSLSLCCILELVRTPVVKQSLLWDTAHFGEKIFPRKKSEFAAKPLRSKPQKNPEKTLASLKLWRSRSA